PVLATIGFEDGRLEVGPILHQCRVAGKGGAVLAPDVHGDVSIAYDTTGLEARPLGREVDRALVKPAPGRHPARLARRTVRREVDVVGVGEGAAHLGGELHGHGATGGQACVGTASILPLHFAPGSWEAGARSHCGTGRPPRDRAIRSGRT